MIVVDSNILAYLYLPGEFTEAAEALLEREPEWAAPLLWRSEFRNILAGYLRRGLLSFEHACSLQAEAEALMDGFEFEVPSRCAGIGSGQRLLRLHLRVRGARQSPGRQADHDG